MLSAVVAIPAIPEEGRGGRPADTVEGRVRVYKKLDMFEQHFSLPCARVQPVEQFLNPLFNGEFKSDFNLPSPVIIYDCRLLQKSRFRHSEQQISLAGLHLSPLVANSATRDSF
jgi:hypothetical protein